MTLECEKIKDLYNKLIKQQQHPFPKEREELKVPTRQGVYIIRKGMNVLHVGRTPRGKEGLHQLHGIIIIDKPKVETQNFASLQETTENKSGPQSRNVASLREIPKNKFGAQSKNLASIIRGYKSAVKKFATMNNIDFAWQPRFHDHIIRYEKSFNTISDYIRNNPGNWMDDTLFEK
jgi:hypothetical protein